MKGTVGPESTGSCQESTRNPQDREGVPLPGNASAAGGTALPKPIPKKEDDDDEDDDDDDDGPRIDLSKELRTQHLFHEPPSRLPILKHGNYHTWSQAHERFFWSRGMLGWVTGETVKPRMKSQADRWREINSYLAFLIAGNVKEMQQTHVSRLGSAQEIWTELRTLHGVSEKGRLTGKVMELVGYKRSAHQTIDAMAADLRKINYEIANLEPKTKLSDTFIACIIMNACQGPEFETMKYLLRFQEPLTSQLAMERLRGVEQDKMARDSELATRQGRGNRPGTAGRTKNSGQKDWSSYQCFNCQEYGHLKKNCKHPKDSRRRHRERAKKAGGRFDND